MEKVVVAELVKAVALVEVLGKVMAAELGVELVKAVASGEELAKVAALEEE